MDRMNPERAAPTTLEFDGVERSSTQSSDATPVSQKPISISSCLKPNCENSSDWRTCDDPCIVIQSMGTGEMTWLIGGCKFIRVIPNKR